MHIEFDATFDDFVDVHLRVLARSKIVQKRKWISAIVNGIIIGALSGLILFALISASNTIKLIYAVFSFVFGFAFGFAFDIGFNILMYPVFVKRRARKIIREQLGTDFPVKFQIDLTDSGIVTKQMDTQTTHDWAGVAAIIDKPDSIEIIMKKGGIIVVRNKGFDSPITRKQFLECAKDYVRLNYIRTNTEQA
jgi:hypothetical protein